MGETTDGNEIWDPAMRRAIELAADSHAPFGAVISRIDRPEVVVFEGVNRSGADRSRTSDTRRTASANSEVLTTA